MIHDLWTMNQEHYNENEHEHDHEYDHHEYKNRMDLDMNTNIYTDMDMVQTCRNVLISQISFNIKVDVSR
jgi:hypothetical protein